VLPLKTFKLKRMLPPLGFELSFQLATAAGKLCCHRTTSFDLHGLHLRNICVATQNLH